MDTIFAPASGRVRAGVSVVRISGPQSGEVLERLTRRPVPPPRRLVLRRLLDSDGEELDTGLVVYFEAGSSFTGEESAELHLHGSIAVVDAVLRSLSAVPGMRLAEAGEFTRRAMENGRLDLAQIEGLADLVAAETDVQRRQAQRLAAGGLRESVSHWRESLVRVLALVEAWIDFPEEEIPGSVLDQADGILATLSASLRRELDGFGMAERIREGFEVAIVGPPNVGKSTLLNALAGRDAAITSEVAGTTRDVIEVRMDLAGLPVTVLDTAGLRTAADRVEALGIERARRRAAGADLRVILLSGPGEVPLLDPSEGDVVVVGRADLFPGSVEAGVSGRTGEGIEELIARIARELAARAAMAGGISHERHRSALLRAVGSLDLARDQLSRKDAGVEMTAEAVRDSMRSLERLVGRVDVEDVLGELFGAFCIGK